MITISISKKKLLVSLLVIVVAVTSVWILAKSLYSNAYVSMGFISDASNLELFTQVMDNNSIPYKLDTDSDGYEYSIRRKDQYKYEMAFIEALGWNAAPSGG